jgi:hypothetical protein
MTRAAVVIPNLNGGAHLVECVESLWKQTLRPASVVVVDNGSTDGSADAVERTFGDVEVIRLGRNTGFAYAVNRGIERAMDLPYVALFNNDAVADEHWLDELVRAAEAHPEAAIVTSKLLQYQRRDVFDSTGDFYSTWCEPFPRGRDQADRGQYDTPEEVFGGSGGASLYRTELFRQIGLFDEDFFAYSEDVDLSFRARLAGWRVRYQPTAVAYHRISETSNRMMGTIRVHMLRNPFLLFVKNVPGPLLPALLPRFVVYWTLFCGRSVLRGEIGAVLRAVLTAFALLPATLRKRRRIQMSAVTDAGDIRALLYPAGVPFTKRKLLRAFPGLRRWIDPPA